MKMLVSQQKAESIVEIIKMGGGEDHQIETEIQPQTQKIQTQRSPEKFHDLSKAI